MVELPYRQPTAHNSAVGEGLFVENFGVIYVALERPSLRRRLFLPSRFALPTQMCRSALSERCQRTASPRLVEPRRPLDFLGERNGRQPERQARRLL